MEPRKSLTFYFGDLDPLGIRVFFVSQLLILAYMHYYDLAANNHISIIFSWAK